MSIFAENKKARFDYEILEEFEGGLELIGLEVKAIKTGKAHLAGSYAIIRGGELWLVGATIDPYQVGNTPPDYDPQRTRRILVKKEEINYLVGKLEAERLTLVPIKLYNKGGLIKISLGLGRGKKKADKRASIKKREVERELGRRLKN